MLCYCLTVFVCVEAVLSDTDGSLELVELNPPDPWTAESREAQELHAGEITVLHKTDHIAQHVPDVNKLFEKALNQCTTLLADYSSHIHTHLNTLHLV